MVFYTINVESPAFLQLKQAGLPAMASGRQAGQATEAPSPVVPAEAGDAGSGLAGVVRSPEPAISVRQAIPVDIMWPGAKPAIWSNPLSGPALIGAAGVGMALMLILAGIFYLTLTRERQLSQASRHLSTRQAEMTAVVPPASNSGVMKGRRWQIVPGGFGGFSSSSSGEAY